MRQNTISIMEAWPTTLFLCEWSEHDHRAPAIVEHLRQRAAGFRSPVASGVATSAKPAKGLIESPLDLFDSTDEPNLLALAAWIRGCVLAAVQKANGSNLPPERLNVRFNQSWFHITNDGGFHDAHVHGNCSWCGIYYLASGDPDDIAAGGADKAGNGINRFYSPLKTGGGLRDYGNAYLGRGYVDIRPTDGRLVLFPSYLLHSALPYRGERDRVILSFNSETRLTQG